MVATAAKNEEEEKERCKEEEIQGEDKNLTDADKGEREVKRVHSFC